MGFLDFISGAVSWVKDKFEDAVYWVKDKLSNKRYDETDIADHVDVDAVLAEFRETIQGDVDQSEKKCMDSITVLFSDLIEKTQEKFPGLVDIIRNEQRRAEAELRGTVMKYVKEHLSKNDAKFLRVLKMSPGKAKKDALDLATDNVLNDAERVFNTKLKKYAENILQEFSGRLSNRIADQEMQMNVRIRELEKLKIEVESERIDVDALKDQSVPLMEASECIIRLLEKEI